MTNTKDAWVVGGVRGDHIEMYDPIEINPPVIEIFYEKEGAQLYVEQLKSGPYLYNIVIGPANKLKTWKAIQKMVLNPDPKAPITEILE